MLTGKNALIYGGGAAIGAAVARVFAREGARLFLAGRSLQRLEEAAGEVRAAGGEVETAALDVLDEEAVGRHAAETARKAGGIDIMLNAVSFPHDQGTTIDGLSLEVFMLPIDRYLRAIAE